MRPLTHRRRMPPAAAVLGGSIALAGCASSPPTPQPTTSAAAAHTVTFTIVGHGTATVDGRRLVSSLAQGANSRATCHTLSPAQGDD